MAAANAFSETVPILGFKQGSTRELDPSTLPVDFRTTWEEEEIGVRSKLILTDECVRIVSSLSVWKSVATLLIVQSCFVAIVGIMSAGLGLVVAIFGLLFLLQYGQSLKRESKGLPFSIAPESRSPERTILVSSIRSIVIRENSNRRDDPHVLQMHLLLNDQTHELIRQELFYRRERLIEEAILLQQWIQRHNRVL